MSFKRVKDVIIGKARDLHDRGVFHQMSLIAFFAWIGLGADGISSSCYGPQEAFLALGRHAYLSIFVALVTVATIFIITASYSQIVELFPNGGGGYLVASKLLSPRWGMISGCALLIDYILTITVSIASGADAVFSLLPAQYVHLRLLFALIAVTLLIVLNMRGIKESILVLAPIFLVFIATHVFIILYAILTHPTGVADIAGAATTDLQHSVKEYGVLGVAALILRSYAMGAGTYTGIEAVSNGMPVLREPRVKTAKTTMQYMAASLAFIVIGLMLGYLVYQVALEPGKTLNAVLFERATASWGSAGPVFVLVALVAEAALLFVAAQAGFMGGPMILANMATDRWFPSRFSTLSDRLVMQNGVLIIGTLAAFLMIVTRGSVEILVVLYSINVFITFVLSQFGMVRHWWRHRATVKNWKSRITINGIGFLMTLFILGMMVIVKFHQGGWATMVITGALVALAWKIHSYYNGVGKQLRRLDSLVTAVEHSAESFLPDGKSNGDFSKPDPKGRTAVVLVSGFNGLGLHTLFGVIRVFSGTFRNFVFLGVGVIDAGNFKGIAEVDNLNANVSSSVKRYVGFMNKNGYFAESRVGISVNSVEGVMDQAPDIMKRYPGAVFFGGQLVFDKEDSFTGLFHNYTVFALQKRLYRENIPFVILPIKV